MDETEINTLFDGDLICNQHVDGYRFSVDSVLLAHFVSVKKNDRILDLGTGSGIISLILLYRHYGTILECSGVELQKSLFELATLNMKENNYENANNLYCCNVKDLKEHCPAGSYNTIVCNPPFYPEASGRVSRNSEARIARHQISANLDDFLFAASHAVQNRGNVYFIYPAELLGDFLKKSVSHRLEAKKLRFIYSYPDSSKGAQLVLIHCCKNGGQGVKVPEPLYIYSERNGVLTREVAKYYENNNHYSTSDRLV
ncbi:tRNA1(Val) (adenine(37)-N6)-methyltransferase [Desulforhopalus sp. 52FAK]